MMIKNAKQKLLALATALTLTLTMAGCTAQSTQETESAEPGGTADGKRGGRQRKCRNPGRGGRGCGI